MPIDFIDFFFLVFWSWSRFYLVLRKQIIGTYYKFCVFIKYIIRYTQYNTLYSIISIYVLYTFVWVFTRTYGKTYRYVYKISIEILWYATRTTIVLNVLCICLAEKYARVYSDSDLIYTLYTKPVYFVSGLSWRTVVELRFEWKSL